MRGANAVAAAQRHLCLPVDFVPVAERSGFIIELGAFTLREALAQLQQFEKAGLDKLFMSVNVSPRQLEHDDVEDILARARRNGCASRAALTGID
ncbi:EAL domain-containing protein [Paraburkholderia sp. CNPSo 3155]|nr:EAL domain-containing protein [Paraburkholderia atlantica]